jgi:hypothetical protein
LFDALADVRQLPKWLSVSLTTLFVASTVGTAMLVTDLGSVLHIVGGTAAAFMVGVVLSYECAGMRERGGHACVLGRGCRGGTTTDGRARTPAAPLSATGPSSCRAR